MYSSDGLRGGAAWLHRGRTNANHLRYTVVFVDQQILACACSLFIVLVELHEALGKQPRQEDAVVRLLLDCVDEIFF